MNSSFTIFTISHNMQRRKMQTDMQDLHNMQDHFCLSFVAFEFSDTVTKDQTALNVPAPNFPSL